MEKSETIAEVLKRDQDLESNLGLLELVILSLRCRLVLPALIREKEEREEIAGYFSRVKAGQRKICDSLRARFRLAKKGNVSKATTEKLIGIDFPGFRKHIESLFQPGMTWENHGQFGWHIDHIRPCVSFDLTDIKQQKACFHFSNLRPLWAEDNLTKGARVSTIT